MDDVRVKVFVSDTTVTVAPARWMCDFHGKGGYWHLCADIPEVPPRTFERTDRDAIAAAVGSMRHALARLEDVGAAREREQAEWDALTGTPPEGPKQTPST